MTNNEDLLHCRVCGFLHQESPWGKTGMDPDYTICPSCGVEAGYEDSTLEATRKYRSEWLESGAPWFSKSAKPEGWSLDEQLKHIPASFRDESLPPSEPD